jgi:hypothetical protein
MLLLLLMVQLELTEALVVILSAVPLLLSGEKKMKL